MTEIRCSFCTKKQSEVKKLIAGPKAFCCNECAYLLVSICWQDGVRPEEGHTSLPPEEWSKFQKWLKAHEGKDGS
jgi:ATP-dependent Clp protease ATP-binding subunit ClpX